MSHVLPYGLLCRGDVGDIPFVATLVTTIELVERHDSAGGQTLPIQG